MSRLKTYYVSIQKDNPHNRGIICWPKRNVRDISHLKKILTFKSSIRTIEPVPVSDEEFVEVLSKSEPSFVISEISKGTLDSLKSKFKILKGHESVKKIQELYHTSTVAIA